MKGQSQAHADFTYLYLTKGADLGHLHMLPLYPNRNTYMGSQMAPTHLTLSHNEGKSQGHWDYEGLYPAKEPSSVTSYYKTLLGNHIWGVQLHLELSGWMTFKGHIQAIDIDIIVSFPVYRQH